jgi:CHAT domain-containing protein
VGTPARWSNVGTLYDVKGSAEAALSSYERAVALYVAAGKAEHAFVAYTYGNMGLVSYRKGDYDQAIAFLGKARSVLLKTLGDRHPETAGPDLNLGLVYTEMGEHEKAIACYESALAIQVASLGPRHTDVASSYNNMGAAYVAKGDLSRGLALHERALEIRREALGPRHPDIASIYRNLGGLAERRGSAALAIANHEKALALFCSNFGPRHPEVAQSSNELGGVYWRQGRSREALLPFEQAIHANRTAPAAASAAGESIGGDPLSDTILLESLDGKARVLADRRFAGRDLRAAVSTYEEASSLLDRIRRGYRSEGSKLLLAERASALHERAIAAALELYRGTGDARHQEVAFRFAEKSRSGILLDALARAEAERFAGIPDTLLSEERALRIDLALYERALSEERLRGRDTHAARLALWQDKLFGLKRAYDALLERLENGYPDYYQLKYDAETASLADVERALPDEHTALVEYFVGADTLFIFVVSRRAVVVEAVAKRPRFERQVEELRQGIVERDLARYATAARGLYEDVLAPVEAETAGMSLVVVPDGSLGVVFFEALLTGASKLSPTDYSRLPYLLHEHDVAYAYSATLLLQKRKAAGRRAAQDFVGFAPVFGSGLRSQGQGEARPLPATRAEVTRILERVRGSHGLLGRWFDTRSRVYLGREARESVVKSHALADYRFVHFATHGLLNEKDPRLSGLVLAPERTPQEDGVLHLGEIYNLRLGAELVVLSACDTGGGKVARGEGVIGLTRGFLYAGAASALVSLWQVSDVTTSELMVDFYGGMLAGGSKPAALRDAKQRLVRRQPEYAKPYYWAPFILVGE